MLASNSAMKEGSDEWIVLDAIGDTHANTNHDDEFDCTTVKSPEPSKDTRINKPRPLTLNWTDDETRMSNIEHAMTKAQFRILQRKVESILCKNESLDDREIRSAELKKDEGPRRMWSKKRKHNRSSTLFLGDFGHSPLQQILVHGEQWGYPLSTDGPTESQPSPREARRCLGEADLRDNKNGRENDSGEILLHLDHINYPNRLNLDSGSADPPKFNNCANNSGGIALDKHKMEPAPEPSCADIVYMQNMWTVDYEGRCGRYTGYLSCPDGVPIGKGRFEYAEKCKNEWIDTGKEKPYRWQYGAGRAVLREWVLLRGLPLLRPETWNR